MFKIEHGDCLEVMKGMPSESVDLTVTSPPYDNLRDYNGYSFDAKATLASLFRVTKEGGVVVWVIGDATIKGSETGTSFRQALASMEIGFKLFDTMIYAKPPRGGFGNINAYIQSFEYMFVFSKGNPKTTNMLKDRKNRKIGMHGGRNRKKDGNFVKKKFYEVKEFGKRTNIWEYSTGRKKEFNHPAVFPEALARDHILSWSNEGDLVLDPFCGSGTTCKMAEILGRNSIGIDISEEYCKMARRRLEHASTLFSVRSHTFN